MPWGEFVCLKKFPCPAPKQHILLGRICFVCNVMSVLRFNCRNKRLQLLEYMGRYTGSYKIVSDAASTFLRISKSGWPEFSVYTGKEHFRAWHCDIIVRFKQQILERRFVPFVFALKPEWLGRAERCLVFGRLVILRNGEQLIDQPVQCLFILRNNLLIIAKYLNGRLIFSYFPFAFCRKCIQVLQGR